MFNSLFHRNEPGQEGAFVVEIRRPVRVRNPTVERLLWICWAVIAVKVPLVFWAVPHYHMPFSAWWVVAPTVVGAAVCTAVYWRRRA
jgi:hypothetical protein